MDPITIAAIITAGVPLLTALFKKILHTDKLPEGKAAMIHQTLPLGIAVAASVMTCAAGLCSGDSCPEQTSWLQCALYGLACGAGGSYLRDFDSNVTKLGLAASSMIARKQDPPKP